MPKMGMHSAYEMPDDNKCVISVTLLGRDTNSYNITNIVACTYDIRLVYNFSVNYTFYNTVLL